MKQSDGLANKGIPLGLMVLMTLLLHFSYLSAQVNSQDSLALVAIYDSLDGKNWNTTWTLSNPVNSWFGVSISNQRVSKLSLFQNGLKGRIPDAIGNLTEVVSLPLFGNQINGKIPMGLGNCTKLQEIQLSGNQLVGRLPDTLKNLTSLVFLDVANNQLSGQIPDWIGEWSELQYLEIHGNSFDGLFPHTISTLTELRGLSIFSNSFIGPIPSLEELDKLQTLLIWDNHLEGSPDDFLGYYPNLTYVALGRNFMFGKLSSHHFNPDTLQYLEISETLLQDIGDFSEFELDQFDVYDNLLTFEDIIPNLSQEKIKYIPQKNVGIPIDTILVQGDTLKLNIILDSSLATNQYQWFRDEIEITSKSSSGELTIGPLQPTHAGAYTCKVTNPAVPMLVIESNPYILNISTATRLIRPSEVIIFPNPFDQYLIVQTNDQDLHNIRLVNVTGQVIVNQDFSGSLRISTQSLPAGMFQVILDKMLVKKITKQP